MGKIVTVGFDDLYSVIQDAVNASGEDMVTVAEKFKAVVAKDGQSVFPPDATPTDFLVGVVVNVMHDSVRADGNVLMILPGEDRTNVEGVVLIGRIAGAVLKFGNDGMMEQFVEMADGMLRATPKDQLRGFLRGQGDGDG